MALLRESACSAHISEWWYPHKHEEIFSLFSNSFTVFMPVSRNTLYLLLYIGRFNAIIGLRAGHDLCDKRVVGLLRQRKCYSDGHKST